MNQAAREARMLAVLYRTYGRDAQWTPPEGGAATGLRVRVDTETVEEGFGPGKTVMTATVIHLRLSDGVEPQPGDRFEVTRETGGADVFRVIDDSEPQKVGGLEWRVEVVESA